MRLMSRLVRRPGHADGTIAGRDPCGITSTTWAQPANGDGCARWLQRGDAHRQRGRPNSSQRPETVAARTPTAAQNPAPARSSSFPTSQPWRPHNAPATHSRVEVPMVPLTPPRASQSPRLTTMSSVEVRWWKIRWGSQAAGSAARHNDLPAARFIRISFHIPCLPASQPPAHLAGFQLLGECLGVRPRLLVHAPSQGPIVWVFPSSLPRLWGHAHPKRI